MSINCLGGCISLVIAGVVGFFIASYFQKFNPPIPAWGIALLVVLAISILGHLMDRMGYKQ